MNKFFVRETLVDFTQEFIESMESGNGFIINRVDNIVDKNRSWNGLYSPRYGTLFGDTNSHMELYTCKCKELQGNIYTGMICPECNTPVKFVDNNMNITGWIVFKKHYFIQPNMYDILTTYIKKAVLENILNFNSKDRIDIDGNFIPIKETIELEEDLYGISIIEFKERFDDIMNFYNVKYKGKYKDKYDFIMKHKAKIFTKFLPVYSMLLRPAVLDSSKNFSASDNNADYNTILKKSIKLNNSRLDDTSKIIDFSNLVEVQKHIMSIRERIFNTIEKKKGHIRRNITGTPLNFSLRAVIVPAINLRTDEIIFPYMGFLELYQKEIINVMMKLDKIPIIKAYQRWYEATLHFDIKVYHIMKYIINNTKGGVRIFINRPPTLNFGGILELRIVNVSDVYDDFTLHIPGIILKIIAGDFDGDTLTAISLKTQKIADLYESLYNPRSNMFVDRENGYFCNWFNLLPDSVITLNQFNKIGQKYRNNIFTSTDKKEYTKPTIKISLKDNI